MKNSIFYSKDFRFIGFTLPVTLIPKLILQVNWVKKIKWDEELPKTPKKQFITQIKEINIIVTQIQVPR